MASIALFEKAGCIAEPTLRVLRVIIKSTARAMSERWFRISHRRDWIVAARREDAAHASIILAVDRNRNLIGADHAARKLLETTGRRFERGLSISAFFRGDFTLGPGRRYCDIAVRLQSPDASSPWLAIITPPDFGALQGRSRERVQIHTRPRLDELDTEIIAAEQRQQRGLPARMLRRIEEYIDVHLDRSLTVEELSSHLGISPSYFARSFRSSVGLTPHAYVMHRRLLRAQELLASTELSLTDIALTTGFADQSHFCRRFHEITGVPPRAFRLQHR
jgi:AraC-like DNA-binding protein